MADRAAPTAPQDVSSPVAADRLVCCDGVFVVEFEFEFAKTETPGSKAKKNFPPKAATLFRGVLEASENQTYEWFFSGSTSKTHLHPKRLPLG